jgi:hypothetical protein
MRVDRRFSLVRCWWAVALLAAAGLRAGPVISEFMASNGSTLQDTDGDYSDWIEVHNPDPVAVDLTGWFLTDSAGSPTKWSFPAVVLAPGEYRVVFASNKDRRLPEAELHTNFALSAGGEYLGLIRPDGAVAFEYAPSFPRQSDNVSYGLPAAEAGGVLPPTFLSTPTPGQPNPSAAVPAPTERVAFSRPAGLFTAPFSLELTGAGAGQVIRYVIRDTSQPEGEGPVLDESSPAYAAPIAIDSTVWIRAAVFAAEGSARGPIATVAYTRVAGGLAGFGSRLPLVVLEGEGQGAREKDGVDHPSWMQVFSPTEGGMVTLEGAPGFATPLTATVRGSSSAEFPKKGYNLKLTDDLGGKRALSLLGLPAHEKWALIAPWRYDRGYVSNSVVYSLSSGMGRWAPRTRLVELFYNTEGSDLDAEDYAGIYVVSDRIEVGSARVAVAALGRNDDAEPEISGGYLLKIDTPDPDEFGWRTQREVPKDEFSQVILVSPKGEDASPAQRDYIVNYVQRMEDALHADQATGFKQRTYLDYIDRASWVDHHILNTFAANPDAFERSAYFTKPRGGRLQAGPVWDFDRALGSYEDERSFRWDVWSGYGGVDHWESGWWAVLARDPEFMQDWVDRWQALRRTLFSPGQLIALAGALTDEIGPDAAARDAARWPDNLNPDGGYAAQVEHLKGWLTQRAQWIDSQFLAPPVVTAEGDRLHFAPPPGAVLVYTTDGSDPRSLGGQLAPNALVSEVPIELAADVNVHVRSYLREWEEVYPGSPWSSAVGGAATSPLSPQVPHRESFHAGPDRKRPGTRPRRPEPGRHRWQVLPAPGRGAQPGGVWDRGFRHGAGAEAARRRRQRTRWQSGLAGWTGRRPAAGDQPVGWRLSPHVRRTGRRVDPPPGGRFVCGGGFGRDRPGGHGNARVLRARYVWAGAQPVDSRLRAAGAGRAGGGICRPRAGAPAGVGAGGGPDAGAQRRAQRARKPGADGLCRPPDPGQQRSVGGGRRERGRADGLGAGGSRTVDRGQRGRRPLAVTRSRTLHGGSFLSGFERGRRPARDLRRALTPGGA